MKFSDSKSLYFIDLSRLFRFHFIDLSRLFRFLDRGVVSQCSFDVEFQELFFLREVARLSSHGVTFRSASFSLANRIHLDGDSIQIALTPVALKSAPCV